jgi:hypothetical protein
MQQRFRDRKKQRLKEVTSIVSTYGLSNTVNLEILTSKVAKRFVVQWYEQTITRKLSIKGYSY